jgi:putative flippase GtrA
VRALLARLGGQSTLSRLGRYALTGGAAAVADLGGFLLLAPHVAPVILAAALSFLIALTVNFALSTAFAFRAAPSWRRFGLFALAAGVGLGINAGVTAGAAALGAPLALAKLIGIGTAFGFNFAANHHLVFPRS